MQYWDDLITQQSWLTLQQLNKKYEKVLIGGWAVFIYTKALKSKDIDIIVDFDVLAQLQKNFHLNKNERLKKYEIKEKQYDIDIYVEYYSNPGLPAEKIMKHTIMHDGFCLPKIELLLILKQRVYQIRKGSIKGEKDKIDLFSLLLQETDFTLYKQLLKTYHLENSQDELIELLQETIEVKEIGLNRQKIAKLKKKIFQSL